MINEKSHTIKMLGSNIGEYKTDLKATEYITKEKIHRFYCLIFKIHTVLK